MRKSASLKRNCRSVLLVRWSSLAGILVAMTILFSPFHGNLTGVNAQSVYTMQPDLNQQFGTGFTSLFTANASGWTSVYNSWAISSGRLYSRGIYGYSSSTSRKTEIYENLDYQVRMRHTGYNASAQGVYVRGVPLATNTLGTNSYKWWQSGIDFGYSNTGYLRVVRFYPGGYAFWKAWTYCSCISTTNFNTLRVIAKGTTYKFYMNGVLVYTRVDSSIASGRIGVHFFDLSSGIDNNFIDSASLTPFVRTNARTDVIPNPGTPDGATFPEWTNPHIALPVTK
ncbi:MAG: hypothetical protein RLY87_2461 [Chloroflexota bacterium]|jgi:hypothetical protein